MLTNYDEKNIQRINRILINQARSLLKPIGEESEMMKCCCGCGRKDFKENMKSKIYKSKRQNRITKFYLPEHLPKDRETIVKANRSKVWK